MPTAESMTASQTKHIKEYVSKLNPNWIGKFLYYCLPIRRLVVLSNMHQVFSSTLTRNEIKTLAQAFYEHACKFIFENIRMRFLSQEQVKEEVGVLGYEHLLKAGEAGQGIALLTGHFGNWELTAVGGILGFQTFRNRFHVVRRTLKNKWLEKVLFRRFYRAGIQIIPKQNALSRVCDALENNDAVVFIMDQYAAISSKDGIEVEFFGKKTGTYRSLASINQYTNPTVIPMQCYRKSKNAHVLEFHPPLVWVEKGESKGNLYANTLQYNQKIEEMLLRYPEQWLWLHKRWK